MMRGDQNSLKSFLKKKTWGVIQLAVAFLEHILSSSHKLHRAEPACKWYKTVASWPIP